MKVKIESSRLVFLFFILATGISEAQVPRSHLLFDSGWKFSRQDLAGSYRSNLNDRPWRDIDLPHDWSIEDLPGQGDSVIGPFDRNSIGGTATGYTIGGVGWYRKHFVLAGSRNRKVSVCFDGVYRNSDVWINEVHLGNHPYGYTGFSYDLTPYLRPAGQTNLIAVRVRNEGRNSRWYSGSGIYRHVWLDLTGPIHLEPGGVFISTRISSGAQAEIGIRAELGNERRLTQLTLKTRILDRTGKAIVIQNTTINASSRDTFASDEAQANHRVDQILKIKDPLLWSPEHPYLYRAVISVYQGHTEVDRVVTPFGIRSIAFDAGSGFLLNGRHTLLRGGCIHHDNGLLGSAAIDRAEERKVELLRAAGYNAVRTSHNPPSPAFLDACDRLGMLVIDEAFDQWEQGKNPQDYHLYFDQCWKNDIDAMVIRDRNHPSVIMWSIGNEIPERADSSGLVIAARLAAEVRRLDPGRPVTEAICPFWDHRDYSWDRSAPAFALLDVAGYNYGRWEYEADHVKYPQRVMVGTESFPREAWENWEKVEKLPYVIGDFVWTAMDYMGETGIGHTGPDNGKDEFAKTWPWFDAWCGDIDLIGEKKPQSWYRDILWKRRTMAMLVHEPMGEDEKEKVSDWGWPDEYPTWTFPDHEGDSLRVSVYSRFPAVRLLLNGKIIGEKAIPDTSRFAASFKVSYRSGELKAVGFDHGKAMDSVSLRTAGKPYRIRLMSDRMAIRSSQNDLAYVRVAVVDEKDSVVPNAAIPIRFLVKGNGRIAGNGSANPAGMHSFQQPESTTFRGRSLVILRPIGKVGKILLTARAPGLKEGQLIVRVDEARH